jgi:hypothetical protein
MAGGGYCPGGVAGQTRHVGAGGCLVLAEQLFKDPARAGGVARGEALARVGGIDGFAPRFFVTSIEYDEWGRLLVAKWVGLMATVAPWRRPRESMLLL